jgi:hypothetical protein
LKDSKANHFLAGSTLDRGNRVSRTPILCVLARTFTGNGVAIPFILDTSALKALAAAKGLSLSPLEPGGSIYFVLPRAQFVQELGELDSTAFPVAVARYKRRLFQALRAEGFTEQQALSIVAAERTPIADVPILKP